MSEAEATWVYAVVPEDSVVGAATPAGVAGEPVRVVSRAGLSAVVGSVDAAEVAEATLRRNLADEFWLERAVRSHHHVVATFFRAAPTVPFRLATVYRDDRRVLNMLDQRRAELADALAVVAGRAEWGVQALTVGPPHAAVAAPAAGDVGRPGTSYLLRRKAERSARDAARRSAADAALAIHSALEDLAMAVRQSPPGRVPPGQQGQMVLNACYLVDDHRREEFTQTTRDLAGQHPSLRLRTTGPWPAYSFVELGKEEQP
jgi:hypothetical protein